VKKGENSVFIECRWAQTNQHPQARKKKQLKAITAKFLKKPKHQLLQYIQKFYECSNGTIKNLGKMLGKSQST